MSGLLPDQIAALTQVINDPAVLCANRLGVDVHQVHKTLNCLMMFLSASHARFAQRRFSVSLDPASDGSSPLSPQHILNATASGKPLIWIDDSCRFVRSEQGEINVTAASKRTADGRLEVVVLGTYVYFVAGGSVEAEHDFVQPSKGPPLGQETLRSIHDFQGLFGDHIEFDVRREKSFKYCADRPTRRLLSTPEKTEKIFQRALLNWLDQHVVDKIRVVSETRGFGQDPADVLVITDRGDHIVEVKWLGRNDAGTSWNRDRIDEGLVQVSEYITNDRMLVCGHLVVYDARSRDEHERNSTWDPEFKHAMCSDPRIVFLDDETASQKAASTVRKKTKKKKAVN
jgi:hypothetical protein